MAFDKKPSPRDQAQDLAWEAMEHFGRDDKRAGELCRRALGIYPDCVDAMLMLADLDTELLCDHVAAMRKAVKVGRRDLAPEYFSRHRGHFWGILETRPFMRAMAKLADSLIEWGAPEHIREAIKIQEEMLKLNPNDNQGIRDPLLACYLQCKMYDRAADILDRYNDYSAVFCWGRLLLAYAAGRELVAPLREARLQNPYVELYLGGTKRRPRSRQGFYSPGEESEAVMCAQVLWEAWKKHPHARKWLKATLTPPPYHKTPPMN